MGSWPSGKAARLHREDRGFESLTPYHFTRKVGKYWLVAALWNSVVGKLIEGSIPLLSAI